MNNLSTKTIREIALENPATTRIFENFKIDYCCGGKRKFEDACAVAGVEPKIVSEEILKTLEISIVQDFPEKKTASELIDYIIGKHHVFTKQELVRLPALMRKVCHRHGENFPFLFDLENVFRVLCEDLTPHLRKEELVLFPFIKQLEHSVHWETMMPKPHFQTVNNPVQMMIFEHDTAGDLLRKMREITNKYTLPENACMSFQALYFGLEEFEKDLHQHIHLENNVLFPLALELEQKAHFIGQTV